LRLVLLFALAAGIPLSAVILFGWDYLNHIQAARLSSEFDLNIRRLRSLDVAFPKMLETIQARLMKIIRGRHFLDAAQRRKLLASLSGMRKFVAMPDVMVIRKDRKVVWNRMPQTAEATRMRDTMGQLTPILLHGVNSEEVQSSVFESYSTSTDAVKEMVKSLGSISEMKLAANPMFQFLYPIVEADQKALHLVGLNWPRKSLQDLFLKRHLPATQKRSPGLQVFGLVGKKILLPRTAMSLPENLIRKTLSRFAQSEGIGGQTIRIAGRTFILSVLKPSFLEGVLLGILEPEAAIRVDLDRGRRILWLFAAICTGVSIFFGLYLGAGFLQPIAGLTAGARAMGFRTFEFRLPSGEPDELGALGELFNEAMAGMSELEVAKIIQMSLFPASETLSGQYRIYGVSKSMRQMGGDYFDIQPLPNGRLFLLIGDVSGHGVQAGLVMAMAKALAIAGLQQAALSGKLLEPDQILLFIQENLSRAIRIRWMITCFAAVLDPSDNGLKYANAGHNFPYLFRNGEKPAPIEIPPSMPLTVRRGKPCFGLGNIVIFNGDRLLFYTDGFVEAKDPHGNALGYDRTFPALSGFFTDSPVESCKAIGSWHSKQTADAEPEDDVTIMVLSRQTERTQWKAAP